MRLSGKKVIVTGASRGIGKEIVSLFLNEGADVFAIATKESPHKEEIDNIAREAGRTLVWKYGDVSNESSVNEMLKEIYSSSGGIDILVNNAGITKDGLVFRMDKADWDSVLNINLTGAFLMSQYCAREMIKKRSGSIINMTSVVGIHGNAGQCNYAASKAGLIGFTKSLAQEVSSRGVRVNAIAPGFIESDMTNKLSDAVKSAYLEKIPLKKLGSGKDVAYATLFLASDESTYITGHVLTVDGGMGM